MNALTFSPDNRAASFPDLRLAMRSLAGGVSVITTGLSPNRTGFTATSVVSLSVDPPRIEDKYVGVEFVCLYSQIVELKAKNGKMYLYVAKTNENVYLGKIITEAKSAKLVS